VSGRGKNRFACADDANAIRRPDWVSSAFMWRILWRLTASVGDVVLVWFLLMVVARFVEGDILTPFMLAGFFVAGLCVYGFMWTLGWIWSPFMHPPRPGA
jgi:hypothetical protein